MFGPGVSINTSETSSADTKGISPLTLITDTLSSSFSVGGKQSKDRFIFVVNKMDDRKKEDGDTEQTLDRIRAYLKKHGINNPNLFPAAALPALNIRLIENESVF